MLRLESETGWWLVTHVDHAHLAGAFAAEWGNELFLAPEPRERVLRGVTTHDDGWAARDQQPQITRQGKPSAFSVELVGKYSAFEEIDLADYLAVRERAVRMVAEADPYAALAGFHAHLQPADCARRSHHDPTGSSCPCSTPFSPGSWSFRRICKLGWQRTRSLRRTRSHAERIENHFRLLQACDALSLLSCVDYRATGGSAACTPSAPGGREPDCRRVPGRASLPACPVSLCRVALDL